MFSPVTENDTASMIVDDQREHVQRRASAVIEALPPGQRLMTLIDLQDQLIDCTPDDQITELARWLDRIAPR